MLILFDFYQFKIVNVVKKEEVLESVEIHEEIGRATVRTAEADAQDPMMSIVDVDAVALVHQKSIVPADESVHCIGMFHRQVSSTTHSIFFI